MKNISARNHHDALLHVLEVECLPALKTLAKICKKEEKISQEIKKWPPTKTGYGDLITVKRALVCLLCVRATTIFGDNRGISFNDIGVKLKKDRIIQKMIRTRHTWFGHVGRNTDEIISGKELVESNLENIFANLSALLTSRYFEK